MTEDQEIWVKISFYVCRKKKWFSSLFLVPGNWQQDPFQKLFFNHEHAIGLNKTVKEVISMVGDI